MLHCYSIRRAGAKIVSLASPIPAFSNCPGITTPRSRKLALAAPFKLLLVSHEASRSGAPVMLLNLIRSFVGRREIDCWVILDRGGDLASEFAEAGPTLAIDRLIAEGYSQDTAYALIASTFRSYAEAGVAICNTVATRRCMEVMAQHGVPILAWLHEMPTTIDVFFGGKSTVDHIARAVRRIVCPSEFVRQALIHTYGISPSQIVGVHNGIRLPSRNQDWQEGREIILQEFGIPKDAVPARRRLATRPTEWQHTQ